VTQQPLWRSTDPPTSIEAAPPREAREALEAEILDAHSAVPDLTDDELCDWLSHRHAPSVKTARSRLSKAGVLSDTGRTRPSNRGRPQVVWTLGGPDV